MNGFEDLKIALERIEGLFRKFKVRHHLTGGLVVSFYGEPRYTHDLDLVMEPPVDSPENRQFILLLTDMIKANPEFVRTAIDRHSMIQGIDDESSLKVDIHVGEAVPGELSRSCDVEYFPGLIVSMVSREDAILSKLLWIEKGSAKSRRDVVMMLRGPRPIDVQTLDQRATELGVLELLNEMRQMATGR